MVVVVGRGSGDSRCLDVFVVVVVIVVVSQSLLRYLKSSEILGRFWRGRSGRTQRSWLPGMLIEEPPGRAAPLYVHGPVILGAVWMAILPPVEKRK